MYMSINSNARMRNAMRRGTMQVVPYQSRALAVPRGQQRSSLAGYYNTARTVYNVGRQLYPIAQRGVQLYNQYMSSRPKKNITIRPRRTLTRKVSKLAKSVKATEGVLTYRKRTTSRLLTAVNQKSYGVFADVNTSAYETVLAELRFFNPSSPATLVQGSGASGTYFRNYLFSKVYTKSTIMNNYQVPCKVTIMVCSPKEDTSINPATAFEQGLVDVGNPGATSQLTFFNDSDEFRRLWKVQKTVSKVLQAGKSFVCTYGTKDVVYDPALVDSHGQAYQRKFKCTAILIKVEGVIGHDTSADQQGTLQAGVDLLFDQTFEVKYDAGIDIRYVVVSDTSDSFTNGGVVSSKPVSDNVGYSVA